MLNYHKETQELYIAALYTALYILQQFTPHFTFYNTFTFLQRNDRLLLCDRLPRSDRLLFSDRLPYSDRLLPGDRLLCCGTCAALSQDLLQLAQLCLSEFFSHRHTQ